MYTSKTGKIFEAIVFIAMFVAICGFSFYHIARLIDGM
jgi:hypothetical protein